MTKTYFINNKKIDLNSSEWNLIYSDGRWSDEGFNIYRRRQDDCFILERWSNWQGRGSSVSLLTREEAIEKLLNNSEIHPERVDEAFISIGFKPENF